MGRPNLLIILLLLITGTLVTASAQAPTDQAVYTPPENRWITRHRVACSLKSSEVIMRLIPVFHRSWVEIEQVSVEAGNIRGFYSDNTLLSHMMTVFNVTSDGSYVYVTIYEHSYGGDGEDFSNLDEDIVNPIYEKIVAGLK